MASSANAITYKICHDSVVGKIFHPNFIQAPYVPEVLVWKEGRFELAKKSTAIVIPLVVEGDVTIEFEEGGTSTPVKWDLGDVIYIVEQGVMVSNGKGVVAFLMILNQMKTV